MAKQSKLKKEREYASSGGRPGEDTTFENVVGESKGLKLALARIGDDPKTRRKALRLARQLDLQRRTR